MINRFVKNVIFIDDKYEDVELGLNYFLNLGVSAVHYNPIKMKSENLVSNISPMMVFVDLEYFSGSPDAKQAVNTIREVTKNGHPYILFIWSRQKRLIEDFTTNLRKVENQPLSFHEFDKEMMLSNDSEFERIMNETLYEHISNNSLFFKLFEWEICLQNSIHQTIITNIQLSKISDKVDLEKYLSILSQGKIDVSSLKGSLDALYDILKDNAESYINEIENVTFAEINGNYLDLKLKINRIFMFANVKEGDKYPGVFFEYIYQDESEEYLKTALKNDTCEIKKLLLNITPLCSFANSDVNRLVLINAYEIKMDNSILNHKTPSANFYKLGEYEYNSEKYILFVDFFTVRNESSTTELKAYKRLRSEFLLQTQQNFGNYISRMGTSKLNINKEEKKI